MVVKDVIRHFLKKQNNGRQRAVQSTPPQVVKIPKDGRSTPFLFPVLLLALLLCFGTGCKTSRVAKANAKKATPEFLLDKLVMGQVKADWFDGRAKISFNDERQSISGTASIKIRKDSVIWVSLKKLGFEVVRAMVTADSVYILNRIDNEYMVKGLSFIAEDYGLPANLDVLQNLLLGNPLFFTRKNLRSEAGPDSYHLFAADQGTENHYWLNPEDFRLVRTTIKDQDEGRSMELAQEAYTQVTDKQKISYLRKIALDSRETGRVNVEINFSNVEIDVPMDIRFEIPERYTRVD